jgi:ectoine hydroxylase-related dioxygenase (phytanoyl-CoA dioxygenase family)
VPRLISPQFAAELLKEAKALIDSFNQQSVAEAVGSYSLSSTNKKAHIATMWRNLPDPTIEQEKIWAFSHSAALARVSSQLLRKPGPVRFFRNQLLVKMPSAEKGARTPWHQDFPYLALDRTERPGVWIALDRVTPDMGSLKFVDRSHQLGPLGRMLEDSNQDLLHHFPDIFDEYGVSEPFDLAPGDALIFHPLTFHAAPPNETQAPRWVLLTQHVGAETRFTGAHPRTVKELDEIPIGEKLDHPHFELFEFD